MYVVDVKSHYAVESCKRSGLTGFVIKPIYCLMVLKELRKKKHHRILVTPRDAAVCPINVIGCR